MNNDRVMILEDREAPEFFYKQMVRDELGVPEDSIVSVESKKEALHIEGPLRCLIADLHVLSGESNDMTPDWQHGLDTIVGLITSGKVKPERVIVVSRYLAMRSEIKEKLVEHGVDISSKAFLLPVDPQKLRDATKSILSL